MTERQPNAGNPSLGRLRETRRTDKNQRCRVVVRFYNKRGTTEVDTDQIVPPPALVRPGLETLPTIMSAQGERASRRFIEFFTATISLRDRALLRH